MLDGCGYLTQEGSSEEIAEGIRFFLENGDNETFRKDVQDRLRKRVHQRYTWDYTVGNLMALYSMITPVARRPRAMPVDEWRVGTSPHTGGQEGPTDFTRGGSSGLTSESKP